MLSQRTGRRFNSNLLHQRKQRVEQNCYNPFPFFPAGMASPLFPRGARSSPTGPKKAGRVIAVIIWQAACGKSLPSRHPSG